MKPTAKEPNFPPYMAGDEIYQAALQWQIILWSGEVTDKEQQRFQHWLAASPDHQSAWQQIQRVNDQLDEVPEAITGRVLRVTNSPNISRRKLLFGLGIIAGSGTIAYQLKYTSPWQTITADLRTNRGQFRTEILPDGTELILNTASAVDVQFNNTNRRIRLHNGEIQIVTAQDTSATYRPFIVETRAGNVRAIGTRFTVRQLQNDQTIQVQVFEGAVELSPTLGEPLQIKAGYQAQFNAQKISASSAVEKNSHAWTQGLLVVEGQRLDEFIQELSRYRHGVLRCDPAVAKLIISGVYPLKNTDAILQSLPQALPVRISAISRYWVTVTSP
jgi:transmembrane sensor